MLSELASSIQAIAQPLNSLIKSLVIPPDLIYLIRDTVPDEAWIPAIAQLERKIWAVRARGKVRASHEIGMVVEGLKAKVSIGRSNGIGNASSLTSLCYQGNRVDTATPARAHPAIASIRTDQYSGCADLHPIEIPTAVPIPASTSAQSSGRSTASICCQREGVL